MSLIDFFQLSIIIFFAAIPSLIQISMNSFSDSRSLRASVVWIKILFFLAQLVGGIQVVLLGEISFFMIKQFVSVNFTSRHFVNELTLVSRNGKRVFCPPQLNSKFDGYDRIERSINSSYSLKRQNPLSQAAPALTFKRETPTPSG